MPITRTPIIDDDGSAQTGTVIDNAWKQQLYDQIDAMPVNAAAAAWVDVPFNAANFGAAPSMTWTVEAADVLQNRYSLVGKTLTWSVYLFTTTLAGTASNQLRINIPGPVGSTAKSARFTMPATYISDGGTNVGGIVESVGLTYIAISKINLANFTLGTNSCHLAFTMILELA
jgi:hypothetical protein